MDNSLIPMRISVAMATYNGEKYIEEQLLSICRQTRKPDEIVISDDGSGDATLEIVERVSASEVACGIDFVVITDNPRHGYCGNFEWAIRHTTGDLIFLSDQDDVWMPEKVERICAVKTKYPEIACVIHNAQMIDGNNIPIQGEFHKAIKLDKLPTDAENLAWLDRNIFLESSVSATLANGMVMCISKDFLEVILPFPKTKGLHDCWIGFCAICVDRCVYLAECLTQYRLHDTNLCGNSSRRMNLKVKFKRVATRVKSNESAVLERFCIGKAMLDQFTKYNLHDHSAYETALKVYKIGEVQAQAFQLGGIAGSIKLINLFCNNVRYRRSGRADFFYQLVSVLFKRKNK